MGRKIMTQQAADEHIRLNGGRVFLHRTGSLGYQPHLLSAGNDIVARISDVEPVEVVRVRNKYNEEQADYIVGWRDEGWSFQLCADMLELPIGTTMRWYYRRMDETGAVYTRTVKGQCWCVVPEHLPGYVGSNNPDNGV